MLFEMNPIIIMADGTTINKNGIDNWNSTKCFYIAQADFEMELR